MVYEICICHSSPLTILFAVMVSPNSVSHNVFLPFTPYNVFLGKCILLCVTAINSLMVMFAELGCDVSGCFYYQIF